MKYPIFKTTQSEAWEVFQKAAGRDAYSHRLECGKGALFIKFGLPFGRSRLLAMGTDFSLFSEGDFKSLIKYAKKNNCVSIRCEGYGGEIISEFKTAPVKKSYLPEYTIKLDLNLSEERLLSDMKRKGRYNIGLAEKGNVKVETFDGEDFLSAKNIDEPAVQHNYSKFFEEFYSILKETGGRDGFGIHGKDYYEKMLSSHGKNARLYTASFDGRVIAGIIVIYSEDEAVYYYGASANSERNLMAPYLLQWRAIMDAKNSGKKFYDFMGLGQPASSATNPSHASTSTNFVQGVSAKNIEFDPSDPLFGVGEFKQKFGGNLYKFNQPIDIIISPLFYKIFNFLKQVRG